MSTTEETTPNFNPSNESAHGAESLGAWLARVRADHGADPREMARHLGLNPTIILALEADDFARLGPPVFVRGYLSRYARLLNLSETAVLERYRQQSEASQEPPPLKVVYSRQRQTHVRDLRGVFYLLVVIGIGWAAVRHLDVLDPARLLAWWPGSEPTSAPAPAGKPTAVTTQTHYPFQSSAEEASRQAAPLPPAPVVSEPPAVPRPEPRAESALAGTPPSAPPVPATAPEAVPEPASPEPASAPVATTVAVEEPGTSSPDAPAGARLMLQFSEDCWVQVKDAQGKVLVSGLMKANTSRDLAGEAPFTVTLGNAPAARIALDDQLVDTAIYVPRRGTVSRFTLNSQP